MSIHHKTPRWKPHSYTRTTLTPLQFAAGQLSFYTLLNSQGVTLVAPDPMNPTDPASTILWSFVEMTYSSVAGLFANLSFVDFLGLPVGMSLLSPSGATIRSVAGTQAGAMASVCSALTQKASVEGVPWDKLCEYGSGGDLLRVDSPGKYIAARDGTAFETYWDAYVQEVWARYASEPLYIDAQNDLGVLECSTASGKCLFLLVSICLSPRSQSTSYPLPPSIHPSVLPFPRVLSLTKLVRTGLLSCPGASRPLPAPLSSTDAHSAEDIFACSGIFSTQATDNAVDLAVLPRVCAALNRSTFLLGLPGSDTSSSSSAAPASPSSGSIASNGSDTDTTAPAADAGDAGTAGNVQPGPSPSRYYSAGGPPTNWYSWAVHSVERDGKGYAFAYDDVYPSPSNTTTTASASAGGSSGSGDAGKSSSGSDAGAQVDVSGTVNAAGEEVGVWRVFVGGMTG
ncbi:MAG: hypothetical protein INR71_09700 [Terriglobus roseus]|nr:hypothetical protein [Terriglobus roseus]